MPSGGLDRELMAPIVINALIEKRVDAFVRADNQRADMEPIQFKVCGLPPKKHGKNGSMWGNATEAKKLIALRKAAFDELGSQPLTGKIRLTLTVHAGVKDFDKLDRDARAKAVKNVGDLDNFVAGV